MKAIPDGIIEWIFLGLAYLLTYLLYKKRHQEFELPEKIYLGIACIIIFILCIF